METNRVYTQQFLEESNPFDFEDSFKDLKSNEDKEIMYKINYNPKNKSGSYLEFYLDTPSNKSFLIFGTMYDPLTGLMYLTLYKNRKAVVAYDAVEVFNKFSAHNFTKKVLNDAFIKYKFTGNFSMLNEDLSVEKNISLIKRHLTKVSNNIQSLETKIKNLLPIIGDLTYVLSFIYDPDSFGFSEIKQDLPIQLEVIGDSLISLPAYTQDGLDNIYLDKLSCLPYLSKSRFFKDTEIYRKDEIKGKNDHITLNILNQNVDEMLDCQDTVIYSTRTAQTLKNSGYRKLITKDIEYKLNCVDEIKAKADTKEDINLRYSSDNNYFKNNSGKDNDFTYFDSMSHFISKIIIINKAIRKIKI